LSPLEQGDQIFFNYDAEYRKFFTVIYRKKTGERESIEAKVAGK